MYTNDTVNITIVAEATNAMWVNTEHICTMFTLQRNAIFAPLHMFFKGLVVRSLNLIQRWSTHEVKSQESIKEATSALRESNFPKTEGLY